MAWHDARPAHIHNNTKMSHNIQENYTMLYESLLLGGKLSYFITQTKNFTQKNDIRTTLMATHSHIYQLLQIINIFPSRLTYTDNPQDAQDIPHQFFESLAIIASQYGSYIYYSLKQQNITTKQRKMLAELLFLLEYFLRHKVLPNSQSKFAEYLISFTPPKHVSQTSIYQQLTIESHLEDPKIKGLKSNYYYPLIDQEEIEELTQDNFLKMSQDQDISQTGGIPTTQPTQEVQEVAGMQDVSHLFQEMEHEEPVSTEHDESILPQEELETNPKINEFRMRFTIFRQRGYAPTNKTQLKVFQDFLHALKSVDSDVHILPIENTAI